MIQKYCLLLLLMLSSVSGYSQTLNLPQRPANALNGTQFVSLVTSMSLTDRENEIFSQVMSGNIPDFMRTLKPVSITQTINSVSNNVTFYVIPDYIAIGCDSNYFLCPMTPLLAQKICDYTSCTMPTRKMVNSIWSAATVKLSPSTIPPSAQMTTVPIFDQHNTTVWGQRSAVIGAHPLGELVGGDKKDVVISNIIYGNPSPGKVVIYGWHYTSGTAIQPLFAGHEETYADYSHGIRLVKMNCTLNGVATTINNILTSSVLNTLLSDEGVIAVPRYPVAVAQAVVPKSFCVLNNGSGSIRIKIKDYSENSGCIVMHSTDGINFTQIPGLQNDTNILISNLTNEIIHYFKIAGVNNFDTSNYSEVLAAVPSSFSTRVLIVNGFDRNTSGNTFDFIIQHGKSVLACGYLFNSSTNDAFTDNLLHLNQFSIVDYISGEESTIDETFSSTEQTQISNYLNQGGKLFVNGSEIAWDLDNKGSASDKNFINNYLKTQYVNDAPNGQSAIFYGCTPMATQMFNTISPFNFDNGTHGTYNVKYPDVVGGVNGGLNSFYYTGLPTNYAGVIYSGLFPSGSVPGKLVYLGFPFETIYPELTRKNLMQKVLEYFEPLQIPSITASGNLEFCENDSVTLSTAQDFEFSYQWKKNGNFLIGDTLAYLKVSQSGLYEVLLTHNSQQATSSAMQVIVKQNPVASISTIYPETFCQGDSAVLISTSGSNYSWQWYQNSVQINGANINEYAALETGIFSVLVALNGCSTSDSIYITVNPIPTIPVITQNGQLLSTAIASSYQWCNGAGAISGETLQSFQPLQNGIYYVIVSNSFGCTAQSQGFNYVLTSENEINSGENEILISNSIVSVSSKQQGYYEISDISGRRIKSGRFPQGKSFLNLEGFESGIYLLRILSGNKAETFKIAIYSN